MLFLAFLVWNWPFGLFAANWVILALSHSKQRFCCFVANFLFSAVFALKRKVFNLIAANHALPANSSSYHVYETLWMNWNLVYPCSSHSENTNRSVPKLLYWYYDSHYFLVLFFFLEGTVTNPAIRLVLDPVSIFLSLPKGHGKAFVSRRVHLNFRCLFS